MTRESLDQIHEFNGGREEDALERIELIKKIRKTYEWTSVQRRKATVSRVRGRSRDWHVVEGSEMARWTVWREGFLLAFDRALTLDQWVARIKGRV